MSHWEIDPAEFQATWPMQDKIRFWLQYAVLAPSAHNNQPWKVQISDNRLTVRPDMEYVTSGIPRLTLISLAAFIENFCAAAHHFGAHVTLESVKSAVHLPSLSLILSVEEGALHVDELEFQGITKRHTNRGLYRKDPLTTDERSAVVDTPLEEGITLHLVEDAERKEHIALMAGRGHRIALSMPPLRRELSNFANWKDQNSPTGMLIEAMVYQAEKSVPTGKEYILHKLPVAEEAKLSYEKFKTAPLIGVISSVRDDGEGWIRSGRTLQRILNRAAAAGLTHDISAAISEVPIFSGPLRRLLQTSERPQLAFRVGIPQHPDFTVPSPRRDASSIIKA